MPPVFLLCFWSQSSICQFFFWHTPREEGDSTVDRYGLEDAGESYERANDVRWSDNTLKTQTSAKRPKWFLLNPFNQES